MNRAYFEVEDDVVVKYTYTFEAGKNADEIAIVKTEVVMTKEIFQECYRR